MKKYLQRKQTAKERTNPSIFHSRYYVLKSLKKLIYNYSEKSIIVNNVTTIVDYGCAKMPYQSFFMKDNVEYHGADLDGNELANLTLTETGEIPIESDFSDLVLSTQVLEHVKDVDLYLQEANRVTKDNGLLLLSTHGYWMFHPDPNDYHRWTSQGLRELIESNGYEIIEWDGVLSLPAVGIQLFQDGLLSILPRFKFLRCLVAFFLQMLVAFFDIITPRELRKKDAALFILLAKKIDSSS